MPHRPWWWIPEGSPLGQNLRKWLQSGGVQQLRVNGLTQNDGKHVLRRGWRTKVITLNDSAINCSTLIGNDDNIRVNICMD